MKKIIITFSWFVAITLFYSCSKNSDVAPSSTANPEILSKSDIEALNSIPQAKGFDATTVVLPNGLSVKKYLQEVDPAFYSTWGRASADPFDNLGPQDAKNLLIARLSQVAFNLVDKTKHVYPDDGTDKPAQNGIAYSYGSKQYLNRSKPNPSACTYQIHGLDCSGFLFQLFKGAGITIVDGRANDQRDTARLQAAIQKSIPSLSKVKMQDLTITPDKFQAGDIIYWKNENGEAKHIGLILRDATGNLAVFQSNGSPDDCDANLKKGPRPLLLTNPYWFGTNQKYGIVRINVDISGNYTMFFRCTGSTTDAIKLNLTFPTKNTNSFKVNGSGTDYNGATLNCVADLKYDNTTNTLSGNVLTTSPSQTSFYRNDSFSAKLLRDNTAYFPLTLGANNNAGCKAEARLKNNN